MLRRLNTGVYVPPAEPPAPFSPANIPGAILFDASNGSTIGLSGTNVTSWSSTNGAYTLTLVSGANNPVYDAANGRVEFTGTWKALGQDSVSFAQNVPGVTMYTCGRVDAVGAGARFITLSILNNFSTRYGLSYKDTTADVGTGDIGFGGKKTDAGAFFRVLGGTVTTGEYLLHGGVLDLVNQTMQLYKNATSLVSTATTLPAGNGENLTGGINFGSVTGSGSSRFIGALERVVLVNSAVNQATREKIEGYLAWSTGRQALLPVGHPYISAAPTA